MAVKAVDPLQLYVRMLRIRYFEETIERLFSEGAIHGTTHLCIGQEAPPVGVCSQLGESDCVSGSHRGHGHALARGLPPHLLFAELLGRGAGPCKGRGGSQHVSCLALGFLGTNGITGGGVPVATGAALALKRKRPGSIAVAFFGDGAMGQGAVHEALNIASLWKLPALYVCENNLYGMSTHVSRAVAAPSLTARAEAYCIEATSIDGNDVMGIVEAVGPIVASLRDSPRPYFIEARTYRFCGHSKSDQLVYRTREEEAEWRRRDPILRQAEYLADRELATSERIEEICEQTRAEIAECLAAAQQCELPGTDDLCQNVCL